MTIFQSSAGNLVPYRQKLTTSMEDVVSAINGTRTIAKVRFTNITAGAVTVDLEVYNGATQQPLYENYSIAANSYHEFYDDILPNQSKLRASASANDSIWIHVLASLPNKPTG
jgi:ABC-type transport system involved in Fe-S cluster assembly fused permease/ATPase subunit